MALFNWSEKFMLGITEIDEQHKQIVDLINNLSELKTKDRNNEDLEGVVNGLISYTKTHWSFEERLLKQHEYPEFASHVSSVIYCESEQFSAAHSASVIVLLKT